MNQAEISSNLKKLRKEKSLTQNGLAEIIGVSPQAISKWERGESLPDASLWPILSALYETTIDAILQPSNYTNVLKNVQLIRSDVFKMLQQDPYEAIDLFVYLTNAQKHEIIAQFLQRNDYMQIVMQIIPMTNPDHRSMIIDTVLNREDFDNLESLAPYVPIDMKQQVLDSLLDADEQELFDSLDIYFNRR